MLSVDSSCLEGSYNMARGPFRSKLNERWLDVIALGCSTPSEPEDPEGRDDPGSARNSTDRPIKDCEREWTLAVY